MNVKKNTAAILTVGDEILMGQVTNSNAAFISRACTSQGLAVVTQLTVSDEIDKIIQGLESSLAVAEYVFVTGGLGPTDDDLTVEAIAKKFNSKLVLDEEWLKFMDGYFKARGRTMTENNKKQAYLPECAKRIDNDCGSAPGLWIETDGHKIAVMPGVPYEMQSMMKRLQLNAGQGSKVLTRTLFTTGIGESVLATKAEELNPPLREFLKEKAGKVSLAWLPSPVAVKIRITTNDQKLLDETEKHLRQVIEPYFFGASDNFDEILLEEVVGKLLGERNETLATAESCTGGLIANMITNISGSSKYFLGGLVVYSNESKSRDLQVDEKIIKENGAVSEPVVRALAESVRKKFNSTYGIGVSGIAGPDGGTSEKPVGTVWIALSSPKQTVAKKFIFEKDRLRNKQRSAQAALEMLRRELI